MKIPQIRITLSDGFVIEGITTEAVADSIYKVSFGLSSENLNYERLYVHEFSDPKDKDEVQYVVCDKSGSKFSLERWGGTIKDSKLVGELFKVGIPVDFNVMVTNYEKYYVQFVLERKSSFVLRRIFSNVKSNYILEI